MNWYLINTVEMDLSYWVDNVWTTITAPINTVMNVIVYNGTDPYTPADGLALQPSANVYQIGDAYNG
jgi:hypothetical protein